MKEFKITYIPKSHCNQQELDTEISLNIPARYLPNCLATSSSPP